MTSLGTPKSESTQPCYDLMGHPVFRQSISLILNCPPGGDQPLCPHVGLSAGALELCPQNPSLQLYPVAVQDSPAGDLYHLILGINQVQLYFVIETVNVYEFKLNTLPDEAP